MHKCIINLINSKHAHNDVFMLSADYIAYLQSACVRACRGYYVAGT